MTTATDVVFVELWIAKVVGVQAVGEQFPSFCIVLDAVDEDKRLPITVGQAEALSLAARLGGMEGRRPTTYQFTAALVQALGGHVRRIRIDRVVDGVYAATVEVDGAPEMRSVDARPSDALNLATVVGAPIFAAAEVLIEADARRAGESAEAVRLRLALDAPAVTVNAGPP